MKRHLEDHEITAAVAGLALEPDVQGHLESCLNCRQQVTSFLELTDVRRHRLMGEAPDWDGQRRNVLRLISTPSAARSLRTRRWSRPVLAAAAVLVMAVGLGVLWHPADPGSPEDASEFSVEQILAEVDAVLADDSLPGFESIDPGVDDPQAMFENGAS